MPVCAEFFVALLQPLRHRQGENFFEMLEQMCFQGHGGGVHVRVRAAERFGDDFIHQFQFQQIFRGDAQGGGGLGGVGAVFP